MHFLWSFSCMPSSASSFSFVKIQNPNPKPGFDLVQTHKPILEKRCPSLESLLKTVRDHTRSVWTVRVWSRSVSRRFGTIPELSWYRSVLVQKCTQSAALLNCSLTILNSGNWSRIMMIMWNYKIIFTRWNSGQKNGFWSSTQRNATKCPSDTPCRQLTIWQMSKE